jgi:hypothetical protein
MRFERRPYFTESERKGSPAHLQKHTLPPKEGVRWKCSQCGWESAPMYFGEVFEPRHLCPMTPVGAVIAG